MEGSKPLNMCHLISGAPCHLPPLKNAQTVRECASEKETEIARGAVQARKTKDCGRGEWRQQTRHNPSDRPEYPDPLLLPVLPPLHQQPLVRPAQHDNG